MQIVKKMEIQKMFEVVLFVDLISRNGPLNSYKKIINLPFVPFPGLEIELAEEGMFGAVKCASVRWIRPENRFEVWCEDIDVDTFTWEDSPTDELADAAGFAGWSCL